MYSGWTPANIKFKMSQNLSSDVKLTWLLTALAENKAVILTFKKSMLYIQVTVYFNCNHSIIAVMAKWLSH